MCKVVKYWFACQHAFRLRHSKCGGTKHKHTRSGLTTACKSESYLNLLFATDCGPCQHQAFEDDWRRKLSTAEVFLKKLKDKAFPGVEEVAALVEQLKDEFDTATWNTRVLFPHAHKERAVRVNLGHFQKASSPLRKEVLSEDIPEPSEVIGPEHSDYKYDWDYVASTDPLHPVDVRYAHPLDDVDPTWMLNHLSPEEFEQSGGDVGFDTIEADTAWANALKEGNAGSTSWREAAAAAWASESLSAYRINADSDQAPESSIQTSFSHTKTESCAEDKRLLAMQTEMVIIEFWKLVNNKMPTNHDRKSQCQFWMWISALP